jgi:hypothetical protein
MGCRDGCTFRKYCSLEEGKIRGANHVGPKPRLDVGKETSTSSCPVHLRPLDTSVFLRRFKWSFPKGASVRRGFEGGTVLSH